jgi:methyltransferase
MVYTEMQVLLVWPNNPNAVLSNELSCCEPLSLEYLAGAISTRSDVRIWDLRLDPPLHTLVSSYQPDLVGIAIPFTTALPYALQVALEVKQLWPQATLVLGGHHPTVSTMWRDAFSADYIIEGEGGPCLLELLESISDNPKLAKTKNTVVINQAPMKSFDPIASPDRSLLVRHRHKYFHSIYDPVALIRFSAGCPYDCSFCILWKLTERRYVTKNIDRILAEIDDIGTSNLYVVDDEAFINPRRMDILAGEIAYSGIAKNYHMYLRADTAIRNRATLEKWADIGLDSVLVGAESFSDRDLADYSKKAVVSDTLAAIKFLHSNNVKVRANFIIRPEFTESDFKSLEDAVINLGVDLPSFAVLTPLPGTDLYMQNKKRLISENPELFDCYHTLLPTELPLERFYELLADLLINTSRKKHSTTDTPMFYYSNDYLFENMIDKIRVGHLDTFGQDASSIVAQDI